MKKAVECGYWNMFRYNPALQAEGKNRSRSTARHHGRLQGLFDERGPLFLLVQSFPERAEMLFEKAEETAKERYEHLLRLKQLYEVKSDS